MFKSFLINKLSWLLLSLMVVYCDYSSKKWIIKNFMLYETKPVFFYINFFYNRNYGIAFSLFSNKNSYQNEFFAAISVTIIIFLILNMSVNIINDKLINFSYSLIIGGAFSNVLDRLNYGFVVDFIDFNIKNWHFATFNIADCSIFIGVLIKVFKEFYIYKKFKLLKIK